MKDFEFATKHIPRQAHDSGFYHVEMLNYPKATLAIIDLHRRSRLDVTYNLPRKEYNLTDGEGTHYHYEIVMIYVEEENVNWEELEKAVEECWDWLLSHYLL